MYDPEGDVESVGEFLPARKVVNWWPLRIGTGNKVEIFAVE